MKKIKLDNEFRYGESLISRKRLEFLARKCRKTLEKVPGNVLEVGIYKGGSLLVLAEVLKKVDPEYKLHAIDTFTGHPYTDYHPMHPAGRYSDVSKKGIEKLVEEKKLGKWVEIYQGKVEEIFNSLNLKEVSFAHIDCDLYIPVKFCAENVPKIMNTGGVIYFDDYGHKHCPGATMAVNEVYDKAKIRMIRIKNDDTLNGQVETNWAAYVRL